MTPEIDAHLKLVNAPKNLKIMFTFKNDREVHVSCEQYPDLNITQIAIGDTLEVTFESLYLVPKTIIDTM